MKRIAFILVLSLSGCAQIRPAPPLSPIPSACSPVRDTNGKIARNRAAVASFKVTHPCPATGSPYGACPGYVVDHIEPLCNCGPDEPRNMQWQAVGDAKAKDKWERQLCGGRGY